MNASHPVSFFKYMPAETAKIVLETQSLRWSAPSQFNDCFDVCESGFLDGVTSGDVDGEMTDLIIGMLEGTEGIPDKPNNHLKLLLSLVSTDEVVRERFISDLKDGKVGSPKESQALSDLRDAVLGMLPEFRILCLSEIKDSPPMWAHYAGTHTGVVLEILCNRISDSPWLLAQPVKYKPPSKGAVSAKDVARALMHESRTAAQKLLDNWSYTKNKELGI